VAPAIAVGPSPQTVAVDPGINAVYVANSGDNSVSVIDSRTRSVTQTIPVGKNPLPVDPDSHTVYVGNFGDKTVSVIEAQAP
jgi:YVTN family beta-propeller protein